MDDTQPAVAEGKQAQNPELRGLERGRSHQNMLKYSGTAAIACVRVQEYAHASARGIDIEDVNPEYLGQMSQREYCSWLGREVQMLTVMSLKSCPIQFSTRIGLGGCGLLSNHCKHLLFFTQTASLTAPSTHHISKIPSYY
jgi:hypothetical protein